jgi:hypothetical protein
MQPRLYHRWTADMDALVRDLLTCETTYAEIARVLGMRIPGVVARARRLGLRSRIGQNQYVSR